MRQFFSLSARGGSDDIDKYRGREKGRKIEREEEEREEGRARETFILSAGIFMGQPIFAHFALFHFCINGVSVIIYHRLLAYVGLQVDLGHTNVDSQGSLRQQDTAMRTCLRLTIDSTRLDSTGLFGFVWECETIVTDLSIKESQI